MSKRAASGLTLRSWGSHCDREQGLGVRGGREAPRLPSLDPVKLRRRPQQAARRGRAAGRPPRPLPWPSAESPQRSGTPRLSGECIRGLGNVKRRDFADGRTEGGCPQDLGVGAGDAAGGDRGLRPGKGTGRPRTTAPCHGGCHPPVTPSEMHCRYTPTLLGALKLSGTS